MQAWWSGQHESSNCRVPSQEPAIAAAGTGRRIGTVQDCHGTFLFEHIEGVHEHPHSKYIGKRRLPVGHWLSFVGAG
jgi:hypothetical protein